MKTQEPTSKPLLEAARSYHIHLDAWELPAALRQRLADTLGFMDTSFIGCPEGQTLQVAPIMLTQKHRERQAYRKAWSALVKHCSEFSFRGYAEGEFIPEDIPIPEHPGPHHRSSIPFPFRVHTRPLQEKEAFRQMEFHLTLDADRSKPALLESLMDAGLYGAYYQEPGFRTLVLTMQGYVHDIAPLQEVLRNYLENAGGAVGCTLTEERVVDHRLFGIRQERLPPIAGRIEYLSDEAKERAAQAMRKMGMRRSGGHPRTRWGAR